MHLSRTESHATFKLEFVLCCFYPKMSSINVVLLPLLTYFTQNKKVFYLYKTFLTYDLNTTLVQQRCQKHPLVNLFMYIFLKHLSESQVCIEFLVMSYTVYFVDSFWIECKCFDAFFFKFYKNGYINYINLKTDCFLAV